MPFTFSHPALSYPLKKLKPTVFSSTGLIIGCIIPDFEYFCRFNIVSLYSHQSWGIVWFNFPAAFIVSIIFHCLIRNHFIDNLPPSWQQHYARYKTFSWIHHMRTHWCIVFVSCAIGIASHILTDSFTHYSGYFALIFPELRDNIVILRCTMPLFKLIQTILSIGGLLVGTLMLPHIYSRQFWDIIRFSWYWTAVIAIAGMVFAYRVVFGRPFWILSNFVVMVIASLFIGLIVVNVYLTLSQYIFRRENVKKF